MANVPPRPQAGQTDPGSPEAFAAVYADAFPVIVRYLRRRLGDSAAEDAAAEVFLRAYRQHESYEDRSGTPLPWLYAIAANVIAEQRRSERRRLRAMERLAQQHQTASVGGDPAASLGTDPRLLRALRRLSSTDRETFLLIAWGELTREEAGEALGVPAGTIRSRLSRARAQLDRALNDTGDAVDFRPITGDANV